MLALAVTCLMHNRSAVCRYLGCGPLGDPDQLRYHGVNTSLMIQPLKPALTVLPFTPTPAFTLETCALALGTPRIGPPACARSNADCASSGPYRSVSSPRLFSIASAIASATVRYSFPARSRLFSRPELFSRTPGTIGER